MIDLKPEHRKLVEIVLKTHGLLDQAWVFGSRRITGTARQYSDLDLLIKTEQPIPIKQQIQIKAWFSESNLPFKVDLIDWHCLEFEMQESLEKQLVKLSCA